VSAVDWLGNASAASAQACATTPPTPICTYALSPGSASYASAGGSGSVSVTADAGCIWVATSGAAWITLPAGSTGSGNGAVNYSVAANTSSSPRSGAITIAGQSFTVSQSGVVIGDTTPPAGTIVSPTSGSTVGNKNGG